MKRFIAPAFALFAVAGLAIAGEKSEVKSGLEAGRAPPRST